MSYETDYTNPTKMNIFQRISQGSKAGKFFIVFLSIIVTIILYIIGYAFWTISRPLVAIAQLAFLHPHTTWDELTDFKIKYSLKDI